MAKRKKQQIGLQNRLEIVIQSALDYLEEGGIAEFNVVEGRLVIELSGIEENEGHFLATPVPDPAGHNE